MASISLPLITNNVSVYSFMAYLRIELCLQGFNNNTLGILQVLFDI